MRPLSLQVTITGMKANAVAEIQGLYGPVTISEVLLQKIWLRQDFSDKRLCTVDGRPVRVRHAGAWNRLDGPDFIGADLEVGGERRHGDVEVHFYQRDWEAHGHQDNPAFGRVILHVILFPPGHAEPEARTRDGRKLPAIVLLPHLHDDIEAYASREWERGVRDLLDRAAPWLEEAPDARSRRLAEMGRRRWAQKLEHARTRLGEGPPAEVLHRACLEVLGYRRNRVPMAALGGIYPLEAFAAPDLTAESLYQSVAGWKLSGLRPANHPLARIRQYSELVRRRPEWPLELIRAAAKIPVDDLPRNGLCLPVAELRRTSRVLPCLESVRRDVFGQALGGTRWHTLWCDAFWPLLAAINGRDFHGRWFLGAPGDYPDVLRRFLRQIQMLGIRRAPCPNGYFQGALQHFLEEGY